MGADKDNHALDLNAQLRWLARVLPSAPARILDAGCGTGALAQALSGRGYDVTAIDVDPAAVEAARKAGVAALLADLTVYDSEPFEAVVFSLSLHHMHPLEKAAERAGELVAPGGLLVLDEFAWDWADQAAAAWFHDTAELLAVAGVLERVEGLPGPDRLACWRARHADHTGGDAMIQAVSSRLEVAELRREPYLSRYLGGRLEAAARGGRILAALRRIERDQIAAGALPPTGFRLVAQRSLRQIGPPTPEPAGRRSQSQAWTRMRWSRATAGVLDRRPNVHNPAAADRDRALQRCRGAGCGRPLGGPVLLDPRES